MNPGRIPPERPLRAKLRELGLLSREQEAGLPQFLLLATEHDGSRHLAQLLQRHPDCSLPDALATRFFSSRHESHDLDWYIRALGSDVHLVRGEWTPSYVLLPVKTIRLIHDVLPQLRLVFLFRDPAVEAWHSWQEWHTGSGTCPWARADLLGQLRRWISVFPADQFFIGFQEQLHSEPAAFLDKVSEFLGVDLTVPQQDSNLPADSPQQPPVLEVALLREACRSRIEELVACLRDDFGRNAPAQWTGAAAQHLDRELVAQLTEMLSTVVKHDFDDVFLYQAVRSDEATARSHLGSQTATTRPPRNAGSSEIFLAPEHITALGDRPPQLIREGYRGFNVVAFQQEFIVIPQAAGNVDLSRLSSAVLNAKVRAREFLRGHSVADALRTIDEFLIASERNECRASASDGASAPTGTPLPDQNLSAASKAFGADAA